MRRFSSGSTCVTFSRWSDHVLPTSVQTGAKQSASNRSAGSSSAAESRRRVMPKATIVGVREVLPREQLEERLLLGIGRGETGLDQVYAEVVERVRDPHLLVGRQRHSLPLHAVTQSGVVDGDVDGRRHAFDGTGTRSSQSA